MDSELHREYLHSPSAKRTVTAELCPVDSHHEALPPGFGTVFGDLVTELK